MTDDYREAVSRAADRLTLGPAQLAQLALLLRPRSALAEAVRCRPDLPTNILRTRTEVDG